MANRIGLNPTGKKEDPLYQCHPICVQNEVLKIIQGDLRTRSWIDNNNVTHTVQATEGTLIYDKNDVPPRPWFVIAYESGRRVED